MTRTFRIRRAYRDGAIVCLVFFLGMSLTCTAAGFGAGPRIVLLPIASFWTSTALITAYFLRSYYIYQLEISDRQITVTTPLCTRILTIDTATIIRWKTIPRDGAAVVSASLIKIRLNFDHFENLDRVLLINWLRCRVPAEQQSSWPEFCQRWALPLVAPPDDSNTTILYRRQIDRLFAWMLVPSFAVSVALICLDGWKYWPSFFVLVPFWLVMRFLIAAGGTKSQSWQAMPGMKGWLFSFIGIVSGMFAQALSPWLAAIIWGFSAIASVHFFRSINAEERRKRSEAAEQAKTADARWRELTATLAAE